MESNLTFEELSKISYEYLNAQQELCNEKYLLGVHQNWFYDQETGSLSFSNNDKDCLRFRFENIGSISYISKTWLWSWANSYCLENTVQNVLKVKEYGEENGFEKLVNEKWDADIYDGWEMAAIAAYLLKAIGVYRVPNEEETIFSFKLLMRIEFIDELELQKLKAQ